MRRKGPMDTHEVRPALERVGPRSASHVVAACCTGLVYACQAADPVREALQAVTEFVAASTARGAFRPVPGSPDKVASSVLGALVTRLVKLSGADEALWACRRVLHNTRFWEQTLARCRATRFEVDSGEQAAIRDEVSAELALSAGEVCELDLSGADE